MGDSARLGYYRKRLYAPAVLKKLVVISHTEHQTDVNGRVMGWGPTINEINYLAQFWEEGVHVGC